MIRKKDRKRADDPETLFCKIETMESKEDLSSNAVPFIDKDGAEDISFDTLTPGPSQ